MSLFNRLRRRTAKTLRRCFGRESRLLDVRSRRQLQIEALEDRLLLSTVQNFDDPNLGTPFARLQVNNPPGAIEMDGGPTGLGKFLRLVHAPVLPAVVPNVNTITFQTSDAGAFSQVIADFDFRIKPGNGRADGLAFALLNTATSTRPTSNRSRPCLPPRKPTSSGRSELDLTSSRTTTPETTQPTSATTSSGARTATAFQYISIRPF